MLQSVNTHEKQMKGYSISKESNKFDYQLDFASKERSSKRGIKNIKKETKTQELNQLKNVQKPKKKLEN